MRKKGHLKVGLLKDDLKASPEERVRNFEKQREELKREKERRGKNKR